MALIGQDVLEVAVRATGVDEASRGLQGIADALAKVGQGAEDAAAELSALQKAQLAVGGAMVVASAAISRGAVLAYESVERLRRTFQLVLGETPGAALSEELRAFQDFSSLNDGAIRNMARAWVTMSGSADGLIETLRQLDKLGETLEDSEVSAIGRALVLARGAGVVEARSLRQLALSGFPIHAVATELGKDNYTDIAGTDSARFFEAVRNVFDRMEARPNLVSTEIQNALGNLGEAFQPTGELLSALARPLASMANALAAAIETVNEWTKGTLGLVVIGGLLVGGLRLMWGAVSGVTAAMLNLASAATAAATAQGAAGGGAVIPVWGRLMQWLAGAVASLVGAVKAALAFVATGGVAVALATAIATLAAGVGLDYLIAAIVNAISGREVVTPRTPVVLDKVRIALGGGGQSAGQSSPAAETPRRRTDYEQVFDKAWGRSLA